MLDDLPAIVLATGALGAASFGIVEGLKIWRRVGEAGFAALSVTLGRVFDTLAVAYGSDVDRLLRAQYRGDQAELARVIRQGARIGLTPQNAVEVAKSLPAIDAELLSEAAKAVESGAELPPALRNVIARYELAIDARIDAALTLAQDRYRRTVQIAASFVAIAIALGVGWFLWQYHWQAGGGEVNPLLKAGLIGVAAVPLAPVAKDVASALKAATEALRTKR